MSYSYDAVIFDCDGVIVDTETISNTIYISMLGKLGLEVDEQILLDKFTGFSNQETLQNAANLLGKPLPEDFDSEYRQRFQDIIVTQLEPIKGVQQLLKKIPCPIAMATNARRKEMDLKLEKIKLTDTFKTRFCIEDVKNGKPAPDLYLKAAKALGVKPKNCIVIEDSVTGISAGCAAGMTVFAYNEVIDAETQKAAGATESFSSMEELERLLGI